MTPREVLLTVLSEKDADDLIEHRRITIRRPLAKRAAELLVKEFVKFGDPPRAVEIMIERCWQGFKAEWVHERQSRTGNGMLDALGRVSLQ